MQLSLLKERAPRLEPRWYQSEAVEAAFSNWKDQPNLAQIVIAPTGAGKSLIAGLVAGRYLQENPHGRVLVLAHVGELVEQNYGAFRRAFPSMSCGIYAAKMGRKDRRAKVTFAMVQSVVRAVPLFSDVGLIIIDETHLLKHEDSGVYRDTIRGIREARGAAFVKVLGLTATAFRLSSGSLLEPYKDHAPLFETIAYEIDMLDLLEEGYLCKVVARGAKTKLDASGLHKRGGEFIDSEMNAKFNNDETNEAIARETAQAAIEQDRRSILVFGITVDHCTRLRDKIRAHGLSCEVISGQTPMGERRRIIADFRAFKIRCLTSVGVLSTGFDAPAVDLVSLAFLTASPGRYLQTSGRALRPHPGKKDALLLDFGANVARHGLLTSVQGVFKKRKKDDEDDEAAVKECPSCATIVPAGALKCSECGHVWETREAPDREAKLFKASTAAKVMDDASTWADVIDARFRHTTARDGKPGVLLLSYRVHAPAGQLEATEVFCLDHEPSSWALKKGQQEWRKRTGLSAPGSVGEALGRIHELRRPAKVRVVQSDDGRFWNVRGVRF